MSRAALQRGVETAKEICYAKSIKNPQNRTPRRELCTWGTCATEKERVLWNRELPRDSEMAGWRYTAASGVKSCNGTILLAVACPAGVHCPQMHRHRSLRCAHR